MAIFLAFLFIFNASAFKAAVLPSCGPADIATSTAGTITYLVTWTANCSDETSFQVGISTDGISYGTTSTAPLSAVSSTSYSVTGLAVNTRYWFRVSATSGTATSSLNTIGSGTWTLASDPATPTVGTPTISTLPVTLGADNGGTTYSVKVVSTTWTGYLQPTGVLGASESWIAYANLGNGSATTTSGLVANISYTVSVAARNGNASSTGYTATSAKFTLANAPTSITAAADGNIAVAWSGSATQYYAERSDNTLANSGWITASTYSFSSQLSCGSNVFHVKGRNGDNTETAWSDSATVNVSCGGSQGGSGGSTTPLYDAALTINNGVKTTNSTNVALALKAFGAVKMMLANNADFIGASWVNFAGTQNWTLSIGKGLKTIYVKYKDIADNTTTVYSGITYDPGSTVTPAVPATPAAPAAPATPATSASVTLSNGVTLTAGDVVKGTTSKNVSYFGNDGKRYTFPSNKVFFSWFKDWSKVKTVSDDQLGDIALVGTMPYRAGTQLVKIQTDPKVYAVEPGGKLRWIETESVAISLYGSAWAKKVRDVDPTIFPYVYKISTDSISVAIYPAGSLVKSGADTYYIVDATHKRKVTTEGMETNHFNAEEVVSATSDLSGYTVGSDIVGSEIGLSVIK